MVKLIFLLFIAASALLYKFLLGKKLTYLKLPDYIISNKKKDSFFVIQIIVSIILSALATKILSRHVTLFSDFSNNFIVLLMISYILILLLSGFIIDWAIRFTNPTVQALNKKQSLSFETEELMNEQEFWSFINPVDQSTSPEEFKKRLENISNKLSGNHPKQIIKFYNQLHNHRMKLISSDIFQVYHYIWGRKYEGVYFNQFADFIIAQGKSNYQKICGNLDEVCLLDLNLIKLSALSFNQVLNSLFIKQTGMLFPYKSEWENILQSAGQQESTGDVVVKFPNIHMKFR